MLIKDLNRYDSLKAKVIAKARDDGYYLDIIDLEETCITRLYDNCFMLLSKVILVSIITVSTEGYGYIKVKLDSTMEDDFAA